MPFTPSRSQIPKLEVETNSILGNEATDRTEITGNLLVKGNSVVSGSGYMNFGLVAGTSGYGFRDNDGTVEFKRANILDRLATLDIRGQDESC